MYTVCKLLFCDAKKKKNIYALCSLENIRKVYGSVHKLYSAETFNKPLIQEEQIWNKDMKLAPDMFIHAIEKKCKSYMLFMLI